MIDSNKTIFLLKERIRVTKIAFRKKTLIHNRINFYAKEKKRECENKIRNLNKHLVIQEKKISMLRLSMKSEANDLLVKKIETPLIGELKNQEAKVVKLGKKLDQMKTLLMKEIKNKKNTNDESVNLKKNLSKNKKENSDLKKKIQNNRLKITELKKEISNIKHDEKIIATQDPPGDPSNSILECCEILYQAADKIVNENLTIHRVVEAKNIYKMIMSRNNEGNKTGEGVENIFIKNIMSNLIAFAKNVFSNLKNNEKKINDEMERNRNLKNDVDNNNQDLEEVLAANRRNSGDVAGGASFFVSFSDVISVLLCFFILFFALGKVDSDKAKRLASTFHEDTIKVKKYNAYVSPDEFEMMEKVKDLIKNNVDPDSIVAGEKKVIEHVISGSDLFSPGAIEISSEGVRILKQKIKKDLSFGVEEIIIEGHTDDKELTAFPEIQQVYKNDLNFSSERAAIVAKIIVSDLGYSGKIIGIRAYGSNRPLKPNTSDHFRALNRRVVVKIIKKRKINKSINKKDKSPMIKNSKIKKI
tara:strand:+ start:5149 stop:6738 length:1590 start_codon:yes stop_codon:yes gene_type:complete